MYSYPDCKIRADSLAKAASNTLVRINGTWVVISFLIHIISFFQYMTGTELNAKPAPLAEIRYHMNLSPSRFDFVVIEWRSPVFHRVYLLRQGSFLPLYNTRIILAYRMI